MTILNLRKFRIAGFKALDGTTFHFPGQRLLLIGSNGSGKSSVLQALSLVNEFGNGSAQRFFDDRGWSGTDVRCRVRGSTAFRADILLRNNVGGEFLWQFTFSLRNGVNVREVVWHRTSELMSFSRVLDYNLRNRTLRYGNDAVIEGFRLPGSAMAFVDLSSGDDDRQDLQSIAEWAQNITSLELLSPNAMRRGTRGATSDIGVRGERLASFFANLNAARKSEVVKRLKRYYPVSNIETTRKRAGWVDMRIAEAFSRIGGIRPSHASDGLLRLIALCSIPEFSDDIRLVLLDEIEDGLEPHILPELIDEIVSESRSQFIFTSHSPLLTNFFRPIDIHVLSRLRDGAATSMQLSGFKDWGAGLEYLGPGEIWSMAERKSINRRLASNASIQRRRERRAHRIRFSSQWAMDFALEGDA